MDSVHGDDYSTESVPLTANYEFPTLIPQVRMLSSIATERSKPDVVSITADQAIGKRRKPLTAEQVRRELNLGVGTKIVLLLFGRDEVLERVWYEGPNLLPQLGTSEYDAITGPSFSKWHPRPRPEFLYQSKRSLIVSSQLAQFGAPVIPRVDWEVERDVERWAIWANSEADLEVVSLDWTSFHSRSAWNQRFELLRKFDQLTAERLRYIINGVKAPSRLELLTELLGDERLTISCSIMGPPGSRNWGERVSEMQGRIDYAHASTSAA